MPDKSRRQRAKHPAQSKNRKGRPGHPGLLAPPPATVPTEEPVSSSRVTAPAVSVPAPAAVSHPHIAKELRTIGILGVIMLVILIVLAFVLS